MALASMTSLTAANARPPMSSPPPASPSLNAGVAVLRVAEAHLGQGNFTGMPGPWCAWFVDFVLRAAGRRPLASGLAAAALSYGPPETNPQPGDLVVLRGAHGAAEHVGFVVADFGDELEIVSGNWSRRVARARIPRRAALAFVRV